MNDKLHTHLKKLGEDISLSREERERMRHTVRSYMEMKPLRVPTPPAPTRKLGLLLNLRPVAAVLVLAVFVSSAGISYAAEGALPGDLLYPIKRRVNEPVSGALAISVSAKATWAANVAGERIKEAATLAAEGRLSSATQEELRKDFEAHATMAATNINEQANSSPEKSVENAVRFEAKFSEYASVLAEVGANRNVDVARLAVSVKDKTDSIAAVRARAKSSITSTESENKTATRIRTAARAQLDSSTKRAKKSAQSISSSSAASIAEQLERASTTISSGEHFVDTDSIPDAIGAFQDALSATEKVSAFLEASSEIHARTGVVVGEQKDAESDSSLRRVNKSDVRRTQKNDD